MKHQQKYVALYERLSHDDEQLGESNSISHQKELLEEYAKHVLLLYALCTIINSRKEVYLWHRKQQTSMQGSSQT